MEIALGSVGIGYAMMGRAHSLAFSFLSAAFPSDIVQSTHDITDFGVRAKKFIISKVQIHIESPITKDYYRENTLDLSKVERSKNIRNIEMSIVPKIRFISESQCTAHRQGSHISWQTWAMLHWRIQMQNLEETSNSLEQGEWDVTQLVIKSGSRFYS